MVWPFDKKPVYRPNAPKKPLDLKKTLTVALLSLAGMWLFGNLFGILGLKQIGVPLLVVLSSFMLLAAYNLTYQGPIGNKDLALFIILVIVLVLFVAFGKDLMPELFSVAANQIQSAIPVP